MSEDRTDAPADARFVVASAAAGQRLDAAVSTHLGVSRAVARRLVAAGRVRLDGRVAPKGASVAAGAVVTVVGPVERVVRPVPEGAPARPISVVYEDADLLAIDKPAGVPSHPLRADERGTAANFIVAFDPACAEASVDPREGGLVHRLDTPTSGVLVAARSRPAWMALRASLAGAACEKRYLAEVWGAPADEGRIDAAIGRRGRRGRTVQLDGGRNPLPAVTTWKVIERRGPTTLVEARLHAGRPHQVRVHLAAAGFPIVGDDRYGAATATPASTGLRLHAASISFRHPSSGGAMTLSAPPPPWASTGKPFAV